MTTRSPLALAVAAAVALAAPSAATAEPAVGIVAGANVLAGFDTATPGTFASLKPLTGLAAGERVQGLDFRHIVPANVQPAPLPQLFALGVTPGAPNDSVRLYTIDPGTAVATQVGSGSIAVPTGAGYGIDFNPTVDRIRVVNSADQNLRINPNNGARADAPVGDAAINPGGRQISGVAYDRVNLEPTVPPSTSTTLYAISRALGQLGTIGGVNGTPSPNGGTFVAIGPLGIPLDASTTVDFDITFGGTALASATSGGVQGLYRIDLATGAATLVGTTAAPLSALAAIPATTVAFGAPSYAAGESAGAATVTLTRAGSLSPSTSVRWSASNGPSGTVAFAPGEASKSFSVPIAADAIDEPDETATLSLSDPSFPAALGSPAAATLTIADDDPAPDKQAPALRLTGVPRSVGYLKLLRRGVRITVTPNEPVKLEARLLGTTRKAHLSAFNLTLASKKLSLSPRRRTLRLKPGRKALRRPRRSVRLRVQVVATDAAGNRATARKTLRLKRR